MCWNPTFFKESIFNTFGCKIDDLQPRRVRYDGDGKRIEVDVIAISGKDLYLIESKATVKWDKIKKFEKIVSSGKFLHFFPEYKDYNITLIMAAINMRPDMMNYLLKKEMYPMVMSGGYMEIILKPQTETDTSN